MRKIWLLPAAVLLAGITTISAQGIIVSPQWLNEHRNDPGLVIVQPAFLKLDYEKEHIEGARYLWPDWLTFNSPEGTYNPPDPAGATKVLQQLGINKDSRIVLCHNWSDVSITARMFLTLEYLGLKGQVYYLNGGLQAWKKAGYPVTAALPVYKKGNFVAGSINPVLVDKEYVLGALEKHTTEVVDARLKRFYDGDPTGNPRDGHISGALNLPYPDMVDSTNSIKPADSLLNRFIQVLPDKNKEVVAYCFIGQTASVLYLAGRAIGYNMRVYDGSMQEWSRIPELPMEKTKKE
ncbi:MAG: sulfurtransferase [Sphingobacteriales bacterium]|nr:sulfurtransferase [Sphingobacteriales bacterium]